MVLRRKIQELWWEIKWRVIPRHRYNIIRIGKPGYYDQCDQVFLAVMEILKSFVENSMHYISYDWSDDVDLWGQEEVDYQAWLEKEIKEIYHWYTHDYPNRENIQNVIWDDLPPNVPIMTALNNPTDPEAIRYREGLDLLNQLEEYWNNQDQEMLHRVIKIRQTLWS